MTIPCTVVTGGGRGIGAAIAKRMAATAPVIIVGRTKSDLVSTGNDIADAAGVACAVKGDVRFYGTAERAVAAADERGWHVEHLICNAGFAKSGPTHDVLGVEWKKMFDTNVFGALNFVQAVLPGMMERRSGTIVLMSSVAGTKGYAFTTAYCATKHALVGMTRAMAKEYGKHGIVVVPVCPGFVESEMTTRTINGAMERSGISEAEARDRVARVNPQRRIIPAEEIAEAVVAICSGKFPAVSGEPFMMSGGE